MKWKEFKAKTWVRVLSNKYLLVSLIFVVWMLFLDTNSWLIHNELNQDREELLDNRAYFLREIEKDTHTLKRLNDSVEIEKFARENYYMKRPNEEIFIIEYQDSLKK